MGIYCHHCHPLDKTERFLRIYEGAGLSFRLDADGAVVVGIDRPHNWPDGIPTLLMQAFEIRSESIAALLIERGSDLNEPDRLERIDPDGTDEQEMLHEMITR